MAGYFTIDGDKFFYQPEVEGLSNEAFRLFCFCLYGPGRTMLGVRRFILADIPPRFPSWSAETAETALAELEATGLVIYDRESRLMFSPVALDHAPIKGANGVKGARRRLTEMPDTALLIPILEHVLDSAVAAVAAAKAEGKEKPVKELSPIEQEIRARLERLCAQLDGPPIKGVDTPSQGGPGTPYQGATNPLSTPSQGGPEGVSSVAQDIGGVGESPQDRTPLQGGSEGVARGSGGGCKGVPSYPNPNPDPLPLPKPKPPPLNPPRPGPEPECTPGQESGKARGADPNQGGRYGHLDQRQRQKT